MSKKALCPSHTKVSYRNQAAALTAAVRNAAKFGAAFRAYECAVGCGWHLTTKPDNKPLPAAVSSPEGN